MSKRAGPPSQPPPMHGKKDSPRSLQLTDRSDRPVAKVGHQFTDNSILHRFAERGDRGAPPIGHPLQRDVLREPVSRHM
jgi:hypothetical protein